MIVGSGGFGGNSNKVQAAPIEPHLFAPLEFILEISPDALAAHHTSGSMTNDELSVMVSQQIWERLPDTLTLTLVSSGGGSAEIAKSVQFDVLERDAPTAKHCMIVAKDSRVAAYIYSVLGKFHFLSLQCGRVMKLQQAIESSSSTSGSASSFPPALVKAAKKKAKKPSDIPEPTKMNLGDDDYGRLEERIEALAGDTSLIAEVFKQQQQQQADGSSSSGGGSSVTVATSFLQTLRDALEDEALDFTAEHVREFSDRCVKYSGWCAADDDGSPSPFAISVRALHRCKLSLQALKHLLSVTWRNKPYARLAAAVYARFVLSPEDFIVSVAPLFLDETIVAASEDDMFEPLSVCEYVQKLVKEDEVFESFLPVYGAPELVESFVERAEQMKIKHEEALKAKEEAAAAGGKDGGRPSAQVQGAAGAATASAVPKPSASLGMGSIKKLMAHMEEQRRLKENAATMQLLISSGATVADVEGDFDGNGDEDDVELYFSGEDVEDDDTTGGGGGSYFAAKNSNNNNNSADQQQLSKKRKRRQRMREGHVNEQRFLSRNQQLLLSLAGRSKPFKPSDPLYFEF